MSERAPVAYIRRSVARRADPGDISREFQTSKVRELAGAEGPTLTVIDGDWGKTAARDKTDRRLAFLAMLRDIDAGRVSVVYAYSADRLARSVRWSAQLLDSCEAAGTTIVTSEGRYAPGDGMARQMFNFQAMVNESALDGMKAKARSSSAARVARGDAFGSFRYGYRTNAATRARGERVAWERDPDVPLDQVLDLVRANGGNILGSCVELEALGIPAPRGGRTWATSALTRIVEREDPSARPRKTHGKHQPTESVLSHLVACPTCGVFLTPVSSRRALYCRNGSRSRSGSTPHAKYFTKEAPILALLHAETDGRTFTRYTIVPDDEAVAERAASEERWRRANVRYQAGGISDDEFDAEARLHKASTSSPSDDEEGWSLGSEPGLPHVRWDEDPVVVNADLRRLFSEVKLDARTLAPVEARWKHAEWQKVEEVGS